MVSDLQAHAFQVITDFNSRNILPSPQDKLREVRRCGQQFRERFLENSAVHYMRSINLLRVPYPAWYAFNGVYSQQMLKPHLIHLLARMVVIQFSDFDGHLRTLVFNPADFEVGGETPYFKRLSEQTPKILHKLIAPVYSTVLEGLAACGLSPDQVDYISYDHLHTQDVRRWLGNGRSRGLLPNAKLLVHSQELTNVSALLPVQSDWYCPHGLDAIPAERIVTFDTSVQLGHGLAMVHTPGHTEGNHSLVYRAPDGIHVSSENGVASDSWAPQHSRDNGIRRYAKATGVEVILNGNTQESSNAQYLSMVLEKTIAGTCADGDFTNVVPSSECTPHWLFHGAPTSHLWGERQFGTITC
ncbi:MAG: hypothetical protein V4488_10900 [Pseudomonadota bacterium]